MEKTYSIRVSFNHGNDINLDLKGCGLLNIRPGKDYYFINAPIEFTNYLAQLRRLGVTYKITNDRKGCYQTIDLTAYFKNDARELLKNLRKANVINQDNYLNEETKKEKKIKNPEKKVVLSSDDLIKTDEVVVEQPQKGIALEEMTKKEIQPTNIPETTEITSEVQIEKVEEVKEEEVTEPEKIETYSEEELSKMSKNALLEIANSLNITEVSSINTKKEIREAILKIQK